jgi:hypothetical protein
LTKKKILNKNGCGSHEISAFKKIIWRFFLKKELFLRVLLSPNFEKHYYYYYYLIIKSSDSALSCRR